MEKSFRRLSNRKARQAYVQAELVNGVAHQIRILRQQRKWTQMHLAKRLKTSQTVVSRLEDPSYGKFSVKTLLEVGNAFDVALHVRYMSFSDLMVNTWDTSPHRFEAVSYEFERSHIGFYSEVPSRTYVGSLDSTTTSSGQHIVATVRSLEAQAPVLFPVAKVPTFRPSFFELVRSNHKADRK